MKCMYHLKSDKNRINLHGTKRTSQTSCQGRVKWRAVPAGPQKEVQ